MLRISALKDYPTPVAPQFLSSHEMATSRSDKPVPDGEGAAASERHHEAVTRFVLFWGEMASSWGINRTMAQIHALLYAVEDPLDTDEIMARLQISRGNANMNLRSLMNWNLVRKVHRADSRRDYFTAEKDVWAITAQIIRERERREIRPVMQQLEECRATLTSDDELAFEDLDEQEQRFYERIENLVQLMQAFEGFSQVFLPFVQERNRDALRNLVEIAAALRSPSDQE